MKVLNCLCKQCRSRRGKHALYQQQFRKARRKANERLRFALVSRSYDVDIPEKARGEYAA
jgi:hypothetical protein